MLSGWNNFCRNDIDDGLQTSSHFPEFPTLGLRGALPSNNTKDSVKGKGYDRNLCFGIFRVVL